MRTAKQLMAILAVALAGGILALATEYTWTAHASGNINWNDQRNWNDGASGYPDAADDKAIFNGTWDSNCTVNAAITVGEVLVTNGYNSAINLGAKLTVSTNDPTQNGKLTITDPDASLNCNGNDLDVEGVFDLYGTLDGHTGGDANIDLSGPVISFLTRPGATFLAPGSSGSLHINSSRIINQGTFVHNSGTVTFDGNTSTYLNFWDNAVATTFYNITVNKDLSSTMFVIRGYTWVSTTTTVENVLLITNGTVKIYNNSYPQTLIMGTSSNSGRIDAGPVGIFSASVYTNYPATIRAASSSYPFATRGTSGVRWYWDEGGAGSEVHIADMDYSISAGSGSYFATGGDGVTITLDGDCSFNGSQYFRVYGNDEFITGDHNVTITAPYLEIRSGGTYTVGSGTTILSGATAQGFTNAGTFTCGTGTMILTNGSTKVYNNNQAFYNLTMAPGAGKTNTLAAGRVSAISNLLHVVSGTCHTDDNLGKTCTGGGTFVPLPFSLNTIVCGVNPVVEPGATLEAGYPPAGTIFTFW